MFKRAAFFLSTMLSASLALHGSGRAAPACGTGGLRLAPGFCATIFADNIGHARHMVMAPNGVLYVNTWSGRYYRHDKPATGQFLVALRDTKGTGRADVIERFGDSAAQGATGGTGIAYYHGAIYAEEHDRILRFSLPEGAIVPEPRYETVLSGLPLTGDHPMRPFIISVRGALFVDLASATNACQAKNRVQGSAGMTPCVEKETRGGIWRYDADKTDQVFSARERYASGIRNGEGLAYDGEGRLFATQHGRDQLWQNWPGLYTPVQGATIPADVLLELHEGADYGWPQCYYDGFRKKMVLAPEYGGDGGKTAGICAEKPVPVAAFPAHWGPNDLLIDNDPKLPAAWRGGAFIAFHGSWNRAPLRQSGYNVVFQPLSHGKASGNWVVFADGFAGDHVEPGRADFRPSGLAASPDGAIFIADDAHGRIWRVTWHGPAGAAVATAPGTEDMLNVSGGTQLAAGGGGAAVDPDRLTLPPGVERAQLVLGDRIFHGEAADGTCAGCHGSDGKGAMTGPDLTTPVRIWSDGSLQGLEKTITDGVQKPRSYAEPMPADGGSPLSRSDVAAVAAYVWALAHPK